MTLNAKELKLEQQDAEVRTLAQSWDGSPLCSAIVDRYTKKKKFLALRCKISGQVQKSERATAKEHASLEQQGKKHYE
eukprot:scaffold70358_cov69-Cyclotella_meneghiniana.AAC.1